jgi:hypothetical protein
MRIPENFSFTDQQCNAIKKSGLSIYDNISTDNPTLWIPTSELERILNNTLPGISLKNLPLRTRSKVVKEHVCEALGYPIPISFKKTQPRFLGQQFDTYIQKSHNLQIWNEDISPSRRYVIISVSSEDIILKVKVISGDMLAKYDKTGTLTQKYQATCITKGSNAELVHQKDTTLLMPLTLDSHNLNSHASPVTNPKYGELLSISTIFEQLRGLVGISFLDLGYDQERNRGAKLHEIVCQKLGYAHYIEDGQFPDIKHQLLEIKLQTSPTIDLGLVLPNSTAPLSLPSIQGFNVRHCDVRYAVFCGINEGGEILITHLILTTGEAFFERFPQFQGKIVNKKIQLPLPSNFFD